MQGAAVSRPARGQRLGSAAMTGPALALQLQRTVGNRATAQLLQRQLRPGDDIDAIPDPPPAGAAGGCGLCYAEKYKGAIGPRDAGTEAHRIIQQAMRGRYGDILPYEFDVPGRSGGGRLDLVRVVQPNRLEIGEIKPADSDEQAIQDLDFYIKLLNKAYPEWDIGPLKLSCPQPLSFPTLSDNCPTQTLHVANTTGVYLYFCAPSYAQLLSQGCKCKKSRAKTDPPVAFDRLEKSRSLRDMLKKGPPKGTRVDAPEQHPPPVVIPDAINWATVLKGAAAALVVLGIIAALVMTPVEILVGIGAAIGWTIARILAALGLGWATAGAALADSGGGKDPKGTTQGGPAQPVPSDKGPVRKVPSVDPAAKGAPEKAPTPLGPPVLGPAAPPAKAPANTSGTSPNKSKTPAKGTKPPARRALPVGPKASKGNPVTQWATIEGFDPAKAWVGQELFVWDGRPPAAGKSWLLKVTDVTPAAGKGKKVTFESFGEVHAGKRAPEGNVYTVTHPYTAHPSEQDQLQSVIAPIQEPVGMRDKVAPLKARSDPGWGILLGLLARIGQARPAGEQVTR